MRYRSGAIASIAALLLLGVLSCDEQDDRVFDNPNDPNGSNYSPPSVELLEHRIVAGMKDTVTIKGLWKDPSEGSRVTTSLWKHSGFFVDSQEVEGDTVVGRLAFETPGTYRVTVAVRDDRGVWSAGFDTLRVDVHRYEPTTTIRALEDSVEPGDTARFVMSARDTSGTIARYVWLHDGRTDTTVDSVLELRTEATGTRYVMGYVVDDDDNPSQQVNAMVVVALHRPTVRSLQSGDTVRAMVGTRVRLAFAASDPPDDPDGEAVLFRWSTDDGRQGSFEPGDSLELVDSVPKLVTVSVVAVDKDSLASDPAAKVWIRFHSKEPRISFPAQGELLADTVVKFRWIAGALDSSYELFVDTVPDPVRSFGKTRHDSLEAKLPFWNKLCYARVVGRKGGDSASSPVVAFSTPEDVAKSVSLAGLSVEDAEFDTAFMPLDTLYRVHVASTATSVIVRAEGSVSDQVIQCGSAQNTSSIVQSVFLTTIPMTIPVKVWSRDGEHSRVYRIVVTRDISEYVKLSGLSVEGYEMSPAFHPDSTSYVVAIARGDSGAISWKTANNLASVSIAHNGGMDSWNSEAFVRGSVQDTAGVMLTVGRAGVVSNTYRVKARILPSRETRLMSLYWKYNEYFNVDSGYVMRTVGEGTDSVWLTPSLRESQSMKVDGKARATGEFGIGLKPGLNTTKIVVVAEDGISSREYTVLFYRTPSKDNNLSSLLPVKGSLDRAFDASWQSYRVAMPFEWDSASVIPVLASARSSLRVVRMHGSDTDTVVVASGDTVPVQRLAPVDSALWRIVVSAEDTSLRRIYEVRFTRSAPDTIRQLYSLFLGSTKGWLGVSNNYDGGADTLVQASVGHNDSFVVFAGNWYDSWKIGSVKAAWDSGSIHRTKAMRSGFYDTLVPAASDTTDVRMTIVAQDTSLKRVVVLKIYRAAPSVDSTLDWLDARTRLGFVDGRWNAPDSVWRIAVPWQDSVITFRPRSSDPYARRIDVGGKTVATETWLSDSIRLSSVSDTNRIQVVVTAQDTTRRRTYTVNVFRAAMRKDALIKSFGASSGLISPSENANDTNYTLVVGSTVSTVTLAPVLSDSDQAMLVVDGSAAKRTIDLGNVGDTTKTTLVVTAQDPSVKRTYTLGIIREKDPSALFGTIGVDSTLKLEHSPYRVDASVTVKSGITLTIEPGVRIQFSTGRGMTVKGTLKALGTAAQPIVFTRASSANWGFIMFDSTAISAVYDGSGAYAGGSILRHCVIEYSGNASTDNAAALYMKKRHPHLDSTTVQYSQSKGAFSDSLGEVRWNGLIVKGNAGVGIHLRAWKFHLRNSTISDNARGVDLSPTEGFATPTDWTSFDGCGLLRNTSTGDGGGILVTVPNYLTNMGISVRNSRFEANTSSGRGGGVYVDRGYTSSGTVELADNVFANNEADAGGGACLKHYYSSFASRNTGNLYEGNKARAAGGFFLFNYGSGSQTETLLDSANVYRGNQSTGTSGYAGGFYVNCPSAKTTVVESRFEGNKALASGHGALEAASGGDTVVVAKCRFVGNVGADAGAMRIATLARLEGNLIQANSSSKSVAALRWENDANGRIVDNTFVDNEAPLLDDVSTTSTSVAVLVDGHPVLAGNNFLSSKTNRLVRTSNPSTESDIDANGNWWDTSTSPRFDLLLADKNASLEDANSYAAFDVSTWLTSSNTSAPAKE